MSDLLRPGAVEEGSRAESVFSVKRLEALSTYKCIFSVAGSPHRCHLQMLVIIDHLPINDDHFADVDHRMAASK